MKVFFIKIISIVACIYMCACSFGRHPYHDKVAQMIMVGFNGEELTKDNPIYTDISKRHIGGVILFNRNVADASIPKNIRDYDQVKTLIQDLQNLSSVPLLIAVDQEGGRVARLSKQFDVSEKSAWQLGQENNLQQTKLETEKTAKVLQDLGFNVNFAPCVDVMLNPDSPIIARLERSFSANPDIVTQHAEQVIQAYNEYKVLPVLKHFPGHGSAQGDTHGGFVDVTQDYRTIELMPYQKLLPKYSNVGVLVAHVFNKQMDNKYPLSLSRRTIKQILRERLKFDGLVFSDDLQMGALTKQYTWHDIVVRAINAGTDVLVIGNNLTYSPTIAQETIDIILSAIDAGEIDTKRIDEAYNRIMRVKQQWK